MGQNMGMGKLGGNTTVFKRKFRWTFEAITPDVPPDFCKLAARPNLSIEETEINFLNAKMFIPGKGTWETITVTYYDTNGDGMGAIFGWIATVYDFIDGDGETSLNQASQWGTYGGTVQLKLYDGCGSTMETWTLKNVWPQAANFGELDYSSSEEVTVELTLRYSFVQLIRNCGDMGSPKTDSCS